MSARKTTITVLAVLLGLAWAAAPPAPAQGIGPESGWVPGQPYVVTISSASGVPLMVVHAGRIPYSTDSRVELVLPGLGEEGLVYAVSTVGDDAGDRPPVSRSPPMARKGQEVVGRVHSVFLQAPLNPALGQGAGVLLVLDEHGPTLSLDSGTPGDGGGPFADLHAIGGMSMLPQGGVLDMRPGVPRRGLDGGRVATRGELSPPVPHGGQRRTMRPMEPRRMQTLPDGFGSLLPGDHVTGTGDRATGLDSGGPGVPEEAGAAPCSKGPYSTGSVGNLVSQDGVLGMQPSVPRRSLDGGRFLGEDLGTPKRDTPPHALRPVRRVDFVTRVVFPEVGVFGGQARLSVGFGDQGLSLVGSKG